ncbi:MAG: hypothetical protein KGJ78_01625 [Alphaproteobacteria bacterium]|nr:hypothetical protein [Alphaproteobacteria bacterium]
MTSLFELRDRADRYRRFSAEAVHAARHAATADLERAYWLVAATWSALADHIEAHVHTRLLIEELEEAKERAEEWPPEIVEHREKGCAKRAV